MISAKRQATYWGISIATVIISQLLERFGSTQKDKTTAWMPYLVAPMMLLYMVGSDAMCLSTSRLSKEAIALFPTEFHRGIITFVLLSLGHFASQLRLLYLDEVPDQTIAQEAIMHALMNFVVLAEAEYWTDKKPSKDLYLIKLRNYFELSEASGYPQMERRWALEHPEGYFMTSKLGLSIRCLWFTCFVIIASTVRWVVLGDPTFCHDTAKMLTGSEVLKLPILLPMLLGAPLRLAAETVTRKILAYVRILSRDGHTDDPHREVVLKDGTVLHADCLEALEAKTSDLVSEMEANAKEARALQAKYAEELAKLPLDRVE